LSIVAILVAAAAAARILFARIARISVGSRLFGGRSDILAIFFLVQLKKIQK
jgi:ABC-type Mn2+/Zn2+ transport system permease subunit